MRSSLPQTGVIVIFLSLAMLTVVLAGCRTPQSEPVPRVGESPASVSPAWKAVWNGRYSEHIQPIFDQYCVSCHGPARAERDLRLDSHEAVMRGGEHGPIVIPGNTTASTLIPVVDGTATGTSRMPPTGPRLTSTEVQNLVVWIEAGAPAD